MNAQTIKRPILTMLHHPSAVIVGALCGLAVALWWPQIDRAADSLYDAIFPVATGTAEIVSRTDTEVVYSLRVTRRRECVYGPPPQAYVELPTGDLALAQIERIDRPAPGMSYPAGATYYSGTWRIKPITGAVHARMVARYHCDGRLTHAVLADLSL